MPVMERWQGKTAVVTGAAGGIGGAIVEKLAEAGLLVVGIDVNADTKASNSKKIFVNCDITDLTKLTDTFKTIEENYGGVDIMVNCAAVTKLGHITSVGTSKISDADIATVMDVNIKAMIFCCRLAADSMNKRGVDGHIINFNSTAGHHIANNDQLNIYSSSKWAVTAFTQSLFHEFTKFKRKIKTTSISPGLVQTPLSSKLVKDFTGVSALQPDDIADAVAYVISTPPHVNISELTVVPMGEKKK